MLIAVIQASNHDSAEQQIKLVLNKTDGIELRLDYWEQWDLDALATLRRRYTLPMIFTLRKKSQGGFYPHDEAERLQTLLALCQLQPDYVDIEYDVPTDFLQQLHKLYPNIKLMCSYHHFTETPIDLPGILQSMLHPVFAAYKIATYAHSTLDALRMLCFVKNASKKHALTGICMGVDGMCTRILAPVVGNALTYASVSDAYATAPGQLTLHELLSIYQIRNLNTATKIYALLGDPIDKSVGHILHNMAMRLLQKNTVYIKLRIAPHDLEQSVALCRTLSFAGFSITMPLKELIVPLLDQIEIAGQKIHAINSIVVRQHEWIGFNTDGIGAINRLAEKFNLSNQKIIVLGAGGAARSIIYTAMQHGAHVIVVNRTSIKAQQLAQEFDCAVCAIDNIGDVKEIKSTIIINTLPENVFLEEPLNALLHSNGILNNAFAVMDCIYQPINTLFLQAAKQANCICIPGYEMYIGQALMQIKHWLEPTENQIAAIKCEMERYFREV